MRLSPPPLLQIALGRVTFAGVLRARPPAAQHRRLRNVGPVGDPGGPDANGREAERRETGRLRAGRAGPRP